jgi:probable selenium-dependent hydroxylase accessory protein YqeC
VTIKPVLWRALNLDEANPPVVAIVGGGGKTALLYRLGNEAADLDRSAILAGTTRFTPPPAPEHPPTIIETSDDDALEAARAALAPDRPLILHTGAEPKGRLSPITSEIADALSSLPGLDLLALEADGSKLRPFKAPADHEPVIPSSATHVVAVVGLRALNTPLDDEHVHRPERVRAIVGPQDRCTAEVIARVLADDRGGRRHVGSRSYTVLVNQADIDPAAAHELASAIHAASAARVVVASLRDHEQPVIEVLGA